MLVIIACRTYAMSMTPVRPSVCLSVTLVNCVHMQQENGNRQSDPLVCWNNTISRLLFTNFRLMFSF